MEIKERIFKEIDKLPENYLQEILDFVRSLEGKLMEQKVGTAIASKSSLKKDWLRTEEGEAWKSL